MAFNIYSCMQWPTAGIHLGVDCAFKRTYFYRKKKKVKMLANLSKGIQVRHKHIQYADEFIFLRGTDFAVQLDSYKAYPYLYIFLVK